jgi:uncharacterized membrane protein YcaP (DUF421 family)
MPEKVLQTAVCSVISIAALFILTRLMGKKQMAQLTFFDYVIGISIGSIAAEYAIDRSVSTAEGLVALSVFTGVSLLMAMVSIKSYTGRKLLDGTPLILIENGKIIENELKKARLTVNDLLEECRQKDVFNIAEIEFAILETSGRLSVLLKSQNQPLTPKDMNMGTEYKGLCANVIIDGNIIPEHLRAVNLDENWLASELAKHNITDYKDILLAFVDSLGNLNFHPKRTAALKNDFIM